MAAKGSEVPSAVRGGIVAGLIGGVALAVLLTALNLAAGRDIWLAFKGAAFPFIGPRAMAPGLDLPAVVLGTVAHLAIAAAWGLIFGLLVYGFSRLGTVAMGFV